MIECPHWEQGKSQIGGYCAIKKYGTSFVSKQTCHACLGLPQPVAGLGDVVARVTSAIGIKPCGGCGKRRKWLNEKFPLNRQEEQHNDDRPKDHASDDQKGDEGA
jgi:hypothetical protein